MPAHIKSSLIGASVSIPISDGKLALGTWQGIWFLEFRNGKQQRRVLATVQGSCKWWERERSRLGLVGVYIGAHDFSRLRERRGEGRNRRDEKRGEIFRLPVADFTSALIWKDLDSVLLLCPTYWHIWLAPITHNIERTRSPPPQRLDEASEKIFYHRRLCSLRFSSSRLCTFWRKDLN